jgi:hypothetical protein
MGFGDVAERRVRPGILWARQTVGMLAEAISVAGTRQWYSCNAIAGYVAAAFPIAGKARA